LHLNQGGEAWPGGRERFSEEWNLTDAYKEMLDTRLSAMEASSTPPDQKDIDSISNYYNNLKEKGIDTTEFEERIQNLLQGSVERIDINQGGIAGQLHLNRPGYRVGKIIEGAPKVINLITKHGAAFKKFADGLFIKASNAIRQGKGIFKNLTQEQKITQHDNLVKTINTFEKKGTLEGAEQYFGINAEKAFIEAQASVKKSPLKKEVSKTRTMDDLVEDAYNEVSHQLGRTGDYKYDADVLAESIATTGGKIYDDLAAVEKAGIYDLALKRVTKDLKTRMDFKKNLKDVEQKIELQMFDPKGRKPNASGGRISYTEGGLAHILSA